MLASWLCGRYKFFLTQDTIVSFEGNGTEASKKVTLRVPSELYLSLMTLVIRKHKGIHGNFNKECVVALEDHVEREIRKLQVAVKVP